MDYVVAFTKSVMFCAIAFAAVAAGLSAISVRNDLRVISDNTATVAAQSLDTLKQYQSAATVAVQVLDDLHDQSPGIKKLIGNVNSTVSSTNDAVATANRDMDLVTQTVVRPCDPQKSNTVQPCGTLADVARTLNTIRGAVGTMEVAGKHWDKNLTKLDYQEATLYDDFQRDATNLGDLAGSLNVAVKGPVTSIAATTDALETHYAQPILHPSHNPIVRVWNVASPAIIPTLKILGALF